MAETHDSVIRINVQTDAANKFAQLRQETAKLDADMKRLKKSTNNLTTATNEEAAAYNKMRTQLLANKNALHDMERATLKANNALKKNSGFVAGIRKGMLSAAKSMVGVTVAFMAIRKAVVGTFSTLRDFDKNLAELSAITGATGEDLEFYADAAKKVGETTRTSAIDFVTAVKLMGSAKPELLSNKEALVEVTRAAVTLGEASGMELTEATKNLASAMNSFNLPATEAERVMNLLAAASQKGAQEVPYVTEAMNKFGSTAAQAGISIEESVAAVETLGKITPEASVAGTNLRNIFIQMMVAADKQGRTVTSLADELERLAPRLDDVTGLTKDFGKRNLGAVQHLIKNRDALVDMQDAITGTNTAYEQAATNADTLAAAQDRLGNALEGLALGMGDLTGYLASFIDGLADFLFALQKIPQVIEENKVAIIGLGVALVGLNLTTIIASFGTFASVLKVKFLRAIVMSRNAMAAFNLVMTANPIGLVVAAIGLLVAGFATLYNHSEKARAVMDALFSGMKAYVMGAIPMMIEALGGLGNIIAGIFTLDLDRIEEGFNQSKDAIIGYGEDIANAVVDGYNQSIVDSQVANLEVGWSITAPVDEDALRQSMGVMTGPLEEGAVQAFEDLQNSSAIANAAGNAAEDIVDELTAAEKNALAKAKRERQRAYERAANDVVRINTDMLMLAEDLVNDAIEDEWERKLAIMRTNQQREVQEVRDHLNRLLQIQEQYSDRTSQHYIDTEAEIALTRQNIIMMESNHLMEIQDMQTEHNDTMAQESRENMQEQQADMQELAEARRQAFDSMLQDYHTLFGDLANLFEEGTREHAYFALAQIAIDTAMAISSLVAMSEANPANAFTFGMAGVAQFAIGLVRIFANIMQARQIIQGIGYSDSDSSGGGGGGGVNNLAGADTIPDVNYYVSPHEEGGIIGEYARGGMVYGKSHAQGGEKFSAGGRVVELEGGEAVINKKNTAKFRPILSAINSYGGNGVKFAEGGVAPSPDFMNSMTNIHSEQMQYFDELFIGLTQQMAGSINNQKVIVTEQDISAVQSQVKTVQTLSSF